ncbi:MAG: helix-turn-helix domain-containing protein [Bdellovibrionales bacterium]|nr:helix-turn-helix domain-containing protein [Bdellovibrionales bacterium]
MNSAEAASYIRKSVGALRTAVCRGQISCYKWQRRLYFRKTDLDKIIEGSEHIGGI